MGGKKMRTVFEIFALGTAITIQKTGRKRPSKKGTIVMPFREEENKSLP